MKAWRGHIRENYTKPHPLFQEAPPSEAIHLDGHCTVDEWLDQALGSYGGEWRRWREMLLYHSYIHIRPRVYSNVRVGRASTEYSYSINRMYTVHAQFHNCLLGNHLPFQMEEVPVQTIGNDCVFYVFELMTKHASANILLS